jgi:hypothetical protein
MLLDDRYALTSTKLRAIIPDFMEEDYPVFVQFLRAYYEWMEQEGQAQGELNRLVAYRDIDSTLDAFLKHFRDFYLNLIPADSAVTPQRLLTYIRSLYRSKGSEQSYRLLFRLIYNKDVELYYPSDQVLKSSDGRWVRETSIKCVYTPDQNSFVGKRIKGQTSNAVVRVDSVNDYFEGPFHVTEFFVNPDSLSGTFTVGETVTTIDGDTHSTTVYGVITGIMVNSGGTSYVPGDGVRFLEGLAGGGGVGAAAEVHTIGTDAITGISIQDAGEGYVVGDPIIFNNAGTGGAGATAVVSAISPGTIIMEDGDSIIIDDDTGRSFALRHEDVDYYFTTLEIEPFLDVVIDAATYDSVVDHSLATSNASSTLSVLYSDIFNEYLINGIKTPYGRISNTQLLSAGSGYISLPILSVDNPTSRAIEANTGVDIFRLATLVAVTGAGQVKTVKMTSPGVGYVAAPTVHLNEHGDGNATLTAQIGTVVRSGGRYIGTYGQLSSDKKLQDDVLYHPYSYILTVDENINRYRNIVKRLLHPAGSIFFGEFSTATVVDASIQGAMAAGVDASAADNALDFILLGSATVTSGFTFYIIDPTELVTAAVTSPDATSIWKGTNDDMIYPYEDTPVDDMDTLAIGSFYGEYHPVP